MDTHLSAAVEDYLKTIYHLAPGQKLASTQEIADQMGVSPASATGMIQRLAACQPPLAIYRKHQGATLTQAGERAALEVIRHHRLLETYLVTVLGYSWDAVHEEACRLEHVISEEFELRISAVMGHPRRDPHGEPIPNAQLEMPRDDSRLLAALRPHEQATITQVRTSDSALLRYLEGVGITPGVDVEAVGYSPFDETLELQVANRKPVTLGIIITGCIFVEKQSHPRSNRNRKR
jgi:DtxR family transcriptional regulator, Mn-dependent transcriptional regulator